MNLDITGTRLLEDTMQATERFIVHVGGARGGKTVAIVQYLIVQAINNPGNISTIVRKTLPALKATAYRDFKEQMETLNIWDSDCMNLTEMVYTFDNGSVVEFISVDNPQKLRGRKRQIAWLNEANELNEEDFRQVNLRTENKILFDYNPSDSEHWLYELEDNRPLEVRVIKSSYLDNPFLSTDIINEIQTLRERDPEAWKVFGLGERGSARDLVYPNWETQFMFPENCETVCYGLDFGYSDPTALVRVGFKGDDLYVEECLYRSGMTQREITQFVSDVAMRVCIWADAAEPDRIEDLRREGLNITKARKDVAAGIASVKSRRLFVCGDSPNLVSELRMYRWKRDAAGNPTDAVEGKDHLLDALRYAVFNEKGGSVAPWKYAVGRV